MTTSLTLRIFLLPRAGKNEKNEIAKLRENCETGFQESAYPDTENIKKIKRFRESGCMETRDFQDRRVMTTSLTLRIRYLHDTTLLYHTPQILSIGNPDFLPIRQASSLCHHKAAPNQNKNRPTMSRFPRVTYILSAGTWHPGPPQWNGSAPHRRGRWCPLQPS